MTFLAPWAWLAALLAIPILLLYMLRLQRPRVRVPSLLLWEAVLADRYANRPWQRLRRNWLLVLQLLSLFALVAALARPAVPAPLTVRGRLIVLLDASASMQASTASGATRFAAALHELRHLDEGLASGTNFALILVDAQPRLVLRDGDGPAFRRALDRLEPGAGPADWESAAALVAGLATASDTLTLVVSDAALAAPLPPLPGEVRLLTVGEPTPNVGLVALALRRSGTGQQALVRLLNASSASAQRTLALYLDGTLWQQRELTLSAEADLSLTFDELPAAAWVEARLTPADALPLDDRAWVSMAPAQGGSVLLVTPGQPFLLQALRLLPGKLQVDVATSLEPAQGGAYDLLVTDGPITGTLPLGNLWAIAPGPGTPCGTPGAPYTVTGLIRGDWTHPLLAHVDWRDVYIARANAYTPPPEATILLETAQGPLLWVLETAGRRVACLGFALRDSDLPLQVAFPVLTANLVGWLLPPTSTEPALPLPSGHPWTLALPPDAAATLTLPDGTSRPWSSAGGPPAPGLYRLEVKGPDGTETRYVGVALLDPQETDLRPRPLQVGTRPLTPLEERGGWREVSRWPLALALGLILLEAWVWWSRLPRWDSALIWRVVIVLALVLALLGARWVQPTRDLTVVYLLDRSLSTRGAWPQALDFLAEAVAHKAPRDEIGLVVFGREAYVDRLPTADPRWATIATLPHQDATDIEAAIRLGAALIPEGAPGRLVLLSDGLETTGQAEKALAVLTARGLDWQVVPLNGGLQPPEIWIASLHLAAYAYMGDAVTAQLTVGGTQAMPFRLTWRTPDAVGAADLELIGTEGQYAFTFPARQSGVLPVQVCLEAPTDTLSQNNCAAAWVWVQGAPRVLVVGEPTERTPLLAALRQTGLEVETSTPADLPLSPLGLSPYAAVVLVNTPAQAFEPQALQALERYVRDLGGGLLAVGGLQSYGVGGWLDTPLERALPVTMQVRNPDRFPPLAMAIVIDKSGSMSAVEMGVAKIRLAAEGAVRAAEALNTTDTLAVVAYDDRPADVLGPVVLAERDALTAQLLRLQAGGGGIYVRESLQYAYQLLESVPETPGLQRHILLLADGSDAEHQEGVEAWIADTLVPASVTLSVISIGDGPDVAFLRRCAEQGQGRFYLTTRAADLPAIFAQETQQAKRSYIVEQEFYPLPVSAWAPLQDLSSTPYLRGYIATTPKPGAQVVWEATQGDPLLAAWSYGLGRAVAWTSDATGRWASAWMSWPDVSAFWGRVTRWLLPPPFDPGLSVSIVPERFTQVRLNLDVFTPEGDYANGLDLRLTVTYPESGRTVITTTLAQVAPGRYSAVFPTTEPGVAILRIGGARTFTTGWAPPLPAEYLPAPVSAAQATARLAALGSGQLVTAPMPTLAHTLRGNRRSAALSLPLLILALFLWPVDIAWRRLALSPERVWRWLQREAGGIVPSLARQEQGKGRSHFRPLERWKLRGFSRTSQSATRGRSVSPPSQPAAGEEEGDTLAARLKKRLRD